MKACNLKDILHLIIYICHFHLTTLFFHSPCCKEQSTQTRTGKILQTGHINDELFYVFGKL